MRFLLNVLLVLPELLLVSPLVHIYQLESYQAPGYIRSVRRHPGAVYKRLWIAWGIPMAAGTLVGSFGLVRIAVFALASLLTVAAGIWTVFTYKKQPAKKPLVFTARVKRLYAAIALALLVPAALTCLIGSDGYRLIVCQTAGILLLPLWVLVGGFIAQPVENLVKKWYVKDAEKKLAAQKGLIRIGITGSYGKTSTKVILGTILSEKYNTLITPASYNTALGVTRVIREQLKPEHEVFIAEMGARHVGDIAELCRLVHPTYGLITSVGPQHLETFHTQERVTATKYELIDALPESGIAFFPADGGICTDLYEKTKRIPAVLFGFDDARAAVTAKDLSLSEKGCTFTLVTSEGEERRCVTKLLGRHNIQNILGSAAVALKLGLTLEEIEEGIAKLEPVEHRLQLMPTGNGVTVIDDAFNSNPAGAKAALEVLSAFPGRKIIVTPGLVELGEREFAENEKLGREMAPVVTFALLVAGNAEAMEKGLLEAGFDSDCIIKTKTLAQAASALGYLTKAGDTVLFENDLPDHYEM